MMPDGSTLYTLAPLAIYRLPALSTATLLGEPRDEAVATPPSIGARQTRCPQQW
jgi:hypothetical protein